MFGNVQAWERVYLHVSLKCMSVCVNERNGSPNTMNVLQWDWARACNASTIEK